MPGSERPSIEESKLKKQFVGISLSATKLKSTIKKARGSKDTTTNDNKCKIVTNFVYTHCIHRNVMNYILYSGYFCGVNNCGSVQKVSTIQFYVYKIFDHMSATKITHCTIILFNWYY